MSKKLIKYELVNVLEFSIDKYSKSCDVKNCKSHDVFGICIGGAQLSNLVYMSCKKHLAYNVRKAYKLMKKGKKILKKDDKIKLLDYLSKQKDNEAGRLYQVFGNAFLKNSEEVMKK